MAGENPAVYGSYVSPLLQTDQIFVGGGYSSTMFQYNPEANIYSVYVTVMALVNSPDRRLHHRSFVMF